MKDGESYLECWVVLGSFESNRKAEKRKGVFLTRGLPPSSTGKHRELAA